MKIFKRILKFIGLILLIFLALFGMAIGGAVPLAPIRKPDSRVEINKELVVEKKEEESEFEEREMKS